TGGQSRWPSAGNSVAIYGQFFMAANTRAPIRTHPRAEADRQRPDAPMRFAEPGRTGELFSYGGPSTGQGYVHDGPFAVVDVETTGFSPAQGDRVIEIAVARVDRHGRIEDEYSTLLNPEGRDTGALFIHGISNDAVRNAPFFHEVIGDILARLEGTVVVAHNAVFEERFLTSELQRAGVSAPLFPALCTCG
ncbi:3'-5' exonuclease, partial [Arthrobacter sp. SAFR-014]|uniref:3'-5' exonuclease n=1 Tax=unclassified Arthrobacter TaxID=235627 RepID=UPI003F7C699D